MPIGIHDLRLKLGIPNKVCNFCSVEIPVFKVRVDMDSETLGLERISFVEKPANQATVILMEDEPTKLHLSQKEGKNLITGVVLIPGQRVYREQPDLNNGKPAFIEFDEVSIEQLRDKFFKESRGNKTNIAHGKLELDSNYIVESWTKANADDRKEVAIGLAEQPIGTWFATYKVDDDTYSKAQAGEIKGFSIEGTLKFEKQTDIAMAENKPKVKMKKSEAKTFMEQMKDAYTMLEKFFKNEDLGYEEEEEDKLTNTEMAEIDEIKAKLSALTTENAELKAKLEVKSKEVEATKEAAETTKTALSATETKVADLQAEFKKQLDELQVKMSELQTKAATPFGDTIPGSSSANAELPQYMKVANKLQNKK